MLYDQVVYESGDDVEDGVCCRGRDKEGKSMIYFCPLATQLRVKASEWMCDLLLIFLLNHLKMVKV